MSSASYKVIPTEDVVLVSVEPVLLDGVSNKNGTNHFRRSGSGNNLPSPRRSYLNNSSNLNGIIGGSSSAQHAGSSRSTGKANSGSHGFQNYEMKASKWSLIRKYIKGETRTFFGLEGGEELKDEWLSRRKRFASRRYSERNVDSMPPPSPYQPPPGHYGSAHDQPDCRPSTMDHRASSSSARVRTRRTRKKDHVLIIYWNLVRWLFWVRPKCYVTKAAERCGPLGLPEETAAPRAWIGRAPEVSRPLVKLQIKFNLQYLFYRPF